MKRRSFLQLALALAGLPFLPKAAAKPLRFINGQPVGPPPIPVTGWDRILPGTISAFVGNEIPSGWLRCDGKVISRNDYPALVEAIGTPGKLGHQLPEIKSNLVLSGTLNQMAQGQHYIIKT